jgi:hypothetical protein
MKGFHFLEQRGVAGPAAEKHQKLTDSFFEVRFALHIVPGSSRSVLPHTRNRNRNRNPPLNRHSPSSYVIVVLILNA